MLDLGDLVIFTKVVETESFTKAGELLGFPKSKISRRISRLEEHLGSQLLQRSTRAVVLQRKPDLLATPQLLGLGKDPDDRTAGAK